MPTFELRSNVPSASASVTEIASTLPRNADALSSVRVAAVAEISHVVEVELRKPTLSEVLELVLRIGGLMARAGGAAFRVRQAMRRTALALGATAAEFTVSPDAIYASVLNETGCETRVVRIAHVGVNMSSLCRLEVLTRDFSEQRETSSIAAFARELDLIEGAAPLYPRWLSVIGLGAGCAAFCGAIQGTLPQMTMAFLGAAFGHTLRLYWLSRGAPVVSVVFGCAFGSAFFTRLVTKGASMVLVSANVSGIAPSAPVLASVLYLIPGVALVTSLLDVIHSDLAAGLARAAHATLVLVCIAAGLLLSLQLGAWLSL